jgi:hypothetical protein
MDEHSICGGTKKKLLDDGGCIINKLLEVSLPLVD